VVLLSDQQYLLIKENIKGNTIQCQIYYKTQVLSCILYPICVQRTKMIRQFLFIYLLLFNNAALYYYVKHCSGSILDATILISRHY
jgi:hypothetical protein